MPIFIRAASLAAALLVSSLAGTGFSSTAMGQSTFSDKPAQTNPGATPPLQSTAPGTKFTVEAGPISSTKSANEICPKLCTSHNARFTTQWWTTVSGKMSVCQCMAL